MENNLIQVLIAAPQELIRRGIRSLLQDHAQIKVVGEAATGRDAIRLTESLMPDVCLLDSTLKNTPCLETIKALRASELPAELLVLGSSEAEIFSRAAVTAGALGYVLKTDPAEHVIKAVECVAQRQFFLTKAVGNILFADRQQRKQSDLPALTEREAQALHMLASGLSNKEIAGQLHLSVRTVETHRAHIMNKCGVHTMTELLYYSLRNHIVDL